MIRKGAKYFKTPNTDEIDVYKVAKLDDEILVYFVKNFKKDVKFYKRTSMAIKFIESAFYTDEEIKSKLIEEIKNF